MSNEYFYSYSQEGPTSVMDFSTNEITIKVKFDYFKRRQEQNLKIKISPEELTQGFADLGSMYNEYLKVLKERGYV